MFDASRLRRCERSASAFPCTPNKRSSNANAASRLHCRHRCRSCPCRQFDWCDDLFLAKPVPSGCLLFIHVLPVSLSAFFGCVGMSGVIFFPPGGFFFPFLAFVV